MKKSLVQIGILGGMACVLAACNNGTSVQTPGSNKAPIASASETDTYVFGGHKLTLDASASKDEDNNIVTYEWFEGNAKLGSGIKLPYLFSDGTHQVTLKVTDAGNKTSQSSVTIEAECMSAEVLNITQEKRGYLNTATNDKPTYCYKSRLTSGNGTETYTLYMNLLSGTTSTSKGYVALIDEDGEKRYLTEKDYATGFYQEGHYLRKEFSITQDGDYYIAVSREKATNYALSLYPSIANGLKQNDKKEINDNIAMAAPLTMDEHNTITDIFGTLHMTRTEENSLKGTDDTDVYSIEVKAAGTYTFFMNLLEGTENTDEVFVTLTNEGGETTPVTTHKKGWFYKAGNHIRTTLDLKAGTSYLSIYRKSSKTKYAFSLYPSVENGLVQDDKKEINDNISMAAPLSFDSNGTVEVNGSLYTTRIAENSLKGTDDTDVYQIMPSQSGKYRFDTTFTDGERSGGEIYFTLVEEDGEETLLGKPRMKDDTESKTVELTANKRYYITVKRRVNAVKYSLCITKE